MKKHYVFFTRSALPQPDLASSVWAAHSANAAANLGYSAILVYLQRGWQAFNPLELIHPFQLRKPAQKLTRFYNLQPNLKVAPLAMPWPIDAIGGKWTHSSTITCKFYFPIYIKPLTQLVHTRDWNFVKAAIRNGVAAIYEHHHYEDKIFEPEIVHNPLFQVAVTLSDCVQTSMIQCGMPPEKIIKIHSGMNHLFLNRQLEAAEDWRKKLLLEGRQFLVVYGGGLYPFKGVDLLLDVAQELPNIQFVLAGGQDFQVRAYQHLAREKQVENVKFLGYLEQNQLTSLLQAADVLAHPHCSGEAASFTSPLKFFDYLASGTPIAATEIPPLMEFKAANVVAEWCEPDRPLVFARCIEKVLEHYPRRREGYLQNIEMARQFSCENRIAKILSHVEGSMRPPIGS